MDDTGPVGIIILTSIVKTLSQADIAALVMLGFTMLFCLGLSAICSSSENAFFSHRESDIEELRESKSQASRNILYLLSFPKHLLATVLVVNSLGLVAFVVLSSFFIDIVFNIENNPWLQFFIDAIVVTLIVLIFGEVMPKVYATQHYRKSAVFLSYPMRLFMFVCFPFTNLLVKVTTFLEKRIKKRTPELTPEELSHAIDITAEESDAQQEKDILKGIVNITQTQVSQIMKPRMDVHALDDTLTFSQVMDEIRKLRFSRMPVYSDNLDGITGILNIKDIIPFANETKTVEWKKLQRPAFFVPENKKIDDLLHEFRKNRNHLAIVVDEFGGTSGIVTLEDILEEVFGDLQDEFDDEIQQYSRLDDQSYLFEGKTQLVDFVRILHLPVNFFEDANDESDTLGGVLTDMVGKIPLTGEQMNFKNLTFLIDAADLRKVKRIKVTIHEPESENE